LEREEEERREEEKGRRCSWVKEEKIAGKRSEVQEGEER
jgi:hypothetical protein